jgi:hypothetical protein
VDGHRGAGDAGTVCQLLLGDHGIFFDPAQKLAFSLCHKLALKTIKVYLE